MITSVNSERKKLMHHGETISLGASSDHPSLKGYKFSCTQHLSIFAPYGNKRLAGHWWCL